MEAFDVAAEEAKKKALQMMAFGLPAGEPEKFNDVVTEHKEPYQMTLNDFIDSRQKGPFKLDPFDAKSIHRDDIVAALESGKNISPEILKDYPDLIKGK